MADDIHKEAIERFERIQTAERNQRLLAVEDMRFAHIETGQWDDDAISKRKDRPRYTINRIAGALDQLVGDQRQNRTSINIRPVSSGATEDLADVMTGLIRNIESQSKAENVYDMAFDGIIGGGYGGWRILTEFNDDDVFDQDVVVKPIPSAESSLWFDINAKQYDKRDASHAFYTRFVTKEAFKEKWPDAAVSDFDQEQFDRSGCQAWFSNDLVRIAEYWVKTPIKRKIALLSDGRVIDEEDEKEALDELLASGVSIVKQREADSFRVEQYIMNGAEILKGPTKWAGKFIPLVPVYGKTVEIEGKSYVRGLVRFAKDPQRIYNYATSAAIESAALTPKDPYWVTATQAVGYENQFATFNVQNQPFLFYNADPKQPGPPKRTGAPSVQQALLGQLQQASMDIYSTTGIQPPSLGINPEMQSGKAVIAQQKMGDRGSFIFTDNLSKSIEYTAEIFVDLLPKIYDSARQIRSLNLDGSTEQIEINQTVIDQQTGKTVIVNDLSQGKYDVKVDTGPAYATQRQESAQQLIQLATGSPIFEQLATDLIAKNLDILENEELTSRVRVMMIRQGLVQPTPEEIKELGLDQPQKPDQAKVALIRNANADTAKKAAEVQNIQAKTAKLDVETQQSLIDSQNDTIAGLKTLMEAFLDQVNAGIPLTQQDHAMRIKQGDIVQEGQSTVDPGPNSEQRRDIIGSIVDNQ